MALSEAQERSQFVPGNFRELLRGEAIAARERADGLTEGEPVPPVVDGSTVSGTEAWLAA